VKRNCNWWWGWNKIRRFIDSAETFSSILFQNIED